MSAKDHRRFYLNYPQINVDSFKSVFATVLNKLPVNDPCCRDRNASATFIIIFARGTNG